MTGLAGPGSTRPLVVLVGPPGAGKTTVGRLLAERLGVGFRDTDSDVVELAGKPVSEIFLDEGEARFRELEEEAVRTALASHDGVLALGGGAVLSERTRARLSEQHVVFLAVDVPDAARRVGLNRDRPLLLGNVRAQLRALLEARLPLYRQVAVRTVDTGGRSPADIAADIATDIAAGVAGGPSRADGAGSAADPGTGRETGTQARGQAGPEAG